MTTPRAPNLPLGTCATVVRRGDLFHGFSEGERVELVCNDPPINGEWRSLESGRRYWVPPRCLEVEGDHGPEQSPAQAAGWSEGMTGRVVDTQHREDLIVGERVYLSCDDGSPCPFFRRASCDPDDPNDFLCLYLGRVQPDKVPGGRAPPRDLGAGQRWYVRLPGAEDQPTVLTVTVTAVTERTVVLTSDRQLLGRYVIEEVEWIERLSPRTGPAQK